MREVSLPERRVEVGLSQIRVRVRVRVRVEVELSQIRVRVRVRVRVEVGLSQIQDRTYARGRHHGVIMVTVASVVPPPSPLDVRVRVAPHLPLRD